MRILMALVLSATASVALLFGQAATQTVETIPFRGIMLPGNEVPDTGIMASANAMMFVHVVRDSTGKIISGSVDFNIGYTFPAGTAFTGLHIHKGPAGANGAIVIPTDLSAANVINSDPSGKGNIIRQAQILPSDAASLDAVNGILQDPSQFYVNLHTTTNLGGAVRAQLQRADLLVLMGLMSPANETPPIDGLNASGIAAVYVYAARDAAGNVTSGQVVFDVRYQVPAPVTFTGFHIHDGPAGLPGPVTINSGIGTGPASVASDPSGTGRLVYTIEVAPNTAGFNTMVDMLGNPGAHYINLHTTEFPGGLIRAQLHHTDRNDFNVLMLPTNETPPLTTGPDSMGSAPAKFTTWILRSADGTVPAGVALFDLDYRFPARTEFNGLHIHDQVAGQAGPVTINSGVSVANSVISPTGFGNLFLFAPVTGGAALATLNSLLANPERHYVNLHTATNPGGAVRAQLAAPVTTAPNFRMAVDAALSQPSAGLAPGGLFTVFGSNLTKVTAATINGLLDNSLPTSLNGVQVTIAGKAVPLIYVGPTQINGQVPLDVPSGIQPLVINVGTLMGQSTIDVRQYAPAIFLVNGSAAVLKNTDFSLVTRDNPVAASDIVVVYSTGLGQTTPALTTGGLAPTATFAATAPVTVTIGGQNADVIYSIAAPGFAGLYQTALRVPAGVSGNMPIVLTIGAVKSPPANLQVR